jgi:hypothetical protein
VQASRTAEPAKAGLTASRVSIVCRPAWRAATAIADRSRGYGASAPEQSSSTPLAGVSTAPGWMAGLASLQSPAGTCPSPSQSTHAGGGGGGGAENTSALVEMPIAKPPATSTLSPASRVAECANRARAMPVTGDHVPVATAKRSAPASSPPPRCVPPATRTRPSPMSVAVWAKREAPIGADGDHVPDAGK